MIKGSGERAQWINTWHTSRAPESDPQLATQKPGGLGAVNLSTWGRGQVMAWAH